VQTVRLEHHVRGHGRSYCILVPKLSEVEETRVTDGGDHDRFSHYVEKDEITYALVTGAPVVALCGKIWVPSRDPDKYPICKTCAEVLSRLSE